MKLLVEEREGVGFELMVPELQEVSPSLREALMNDSDDYKRGYRFAMGAFEALLEVISWCGLGVAAMYAIDWILENPRVFIADGEKTAVYALYTAGAAIGITILALVLAVVFQVFEDSTRGWIKDGSLHALFTLMVPVILIASSVSVGLALDKNTIITGHQRVWMIIGGSVGGGVALSWTIAGLVRLRCSGGQSTVLEPVLEIVMVVKTVMGGGNKHEGSIS